jgi:ABC-type transport system involved in multi-copper enzyme maturation permease subunit
MAALAGGDSFYVIVGSAAGALIGLQFVVATLIAERPPLRVAEAGAAFATPTIWHFAAALLLSALLRAPWPAITVAAILWGIVGLSGVVYVVVVARRMRAQTVYEPQFETLAISSSAAACGIRDACGIGIYSTCAHAWDSVCSWSRDAVVAICWHS